MNCPHCGTKASAIRMIKVFRWSNYKCFNCSQESNRKTSNAVILVICAIIIVLALKHLLSIAGITIVFIPQIVFAVLTVVLLEQLFGKLVKV